MGRPSKQRFVVNTTLGHMGVPVADFLKSIEERPILYDKNAEDLGDNKTRMMRDAAWRDLVTSLLPQFKNLPEAEQTFLINKGYKRSWKAHRDLFLKTVRMKQSNDSRFKPYTFRKEMTFFMKASGIAPEDTRYSDDDGEEDEIEEAPVKRKQQNDHGIKSESANDSTSDEHCNNSKKAKVVPTSQATKTSAANTSTPYSAGRARLSRSNVNATPNRNAAEEPEMNESFDPMFFCQTTANGSIDGNPSQQQEESNRETITRDKIANKDPSFVQKKSVHYHGGEDSADGAFFESLKPSLRKMGETQKLDFKIEVLQLLKKYLK